MQNRDLWGDNREASWVVQIDKICSWVCFLGWTASKRQSKTNSMEDCVVKIGCTHPKSTKEVSNPFMEKAGKTFGI